MHSKTPAYNLKAVLLETGLAADTLRAWERRYGLPTPQRTPGGHRLYSQYDIETIKWLIARQAEGLSISRAVDLWNEIAASGSDPLAGSDSKNMILAPGASSPISADTTLDSIRAEWIAACLNFSESQSEQALNKAFSIFPVESVCIEVIQKGMAEIGDLWYENRASVQQEHFASSLALRRLDALLNASPAPTRNQTVLIGCPQGEWHTLTALLLALLLRRRGLNVIYLGANVPDERFADTALEVKASLVILVSQTLTGAARLQRAALAITAKKIPVGFGGRIFNLRSGIVNYIPGYFLGESIESSLNEAENILNGRAKVTSLRAAPQDHLAALNAFNSRRTHIESTFKLNLPPLSIGAEEINDKIQHIGDNIAAALQLGDMDHLSAEMEWLEKLISHHNYSGQDLSEFMVGYSRAVDMHINGQGDPIKKWLQARASP